MASKNISIGPIIQFRKRDAPSTFVFLNTCFNWLYLTFVNGGYIININPMAKGIFVVPEENELMNVDEDGTKFPIHKPTIIARKIHKVRYLSKKLNFFLVEAGVQLFTDIFLFN